MSINHRAEAERLVDGVLNNPEYPELGNGGEGNLLAALVHATLASRETADADIAAYRHTITTMRFALIRHVAEGLALSRGDEAHQHAVGLAKHLDSVGLNVDREADAYIKDHLSWGDPSDAWLSPTDRRAKWDAEMPDPWADTPTEQ